VENALQQLTPKGVAVTLPSIRTDSFSVDLSDMVATARKSGITFRIDSTDLFSIVGDNADGNKLKIRDTNKNDLITIPQGGNVGIGTNTPCMFNPSCTIRGRACSTFPTPGRFTIIQLPKVQLPFESFHAGKI